MSEGIDRKRFARRDYSHEMVSTRPKTTLPSEADKPQAPPTPRVRKKRRSYKKVWLILVIFVLIALVVLGGLWLVEHQSRSLVPKSVQKSVSFPIYYPDPKKLPAGYTLDVGSFATPVKNGATYKVTYDNGKAIVFSVQQKPSDNELQSFQANFLPLKTEYQTGVGQALIGAYNQKTFVSLPVANSGTWLIITAPGDINQDQLKQVLNAIKH